MKIAFVSLNQEKLPDPVVPLGILSIMGNTPAHHEKVLWDLCFEVDCESYLSQKIKEYQPEILALGMRNIQNNDYSDYKTNLNKYKKLVEFIRTLTNVPIILGGSGFSVMPREIMNFIKPNFGIQGEAESSFPHLLTCITAQSDFDSVTNLFYWKDNELKESTGTKSFLNIDNLNLPAREYADPRYFQYTGIANVQTKRGCPLKCTYCTYPTIEGKIKRSKDPKIVVDEMFEAIRIQPNITHFFVVDSVFNHPREHAKNVCRELISRDWKIPWTCYINPISFDESLAELMVSAKCVGFEVGSDSGCDEVLKSLKKGFTTKDIIRLKEISMKQGLMDCHTFILGTPTETHEHVQRSLEFIEKLNPIAAVLMAWVDDYEALDPDLAKQRQTFRSEIIEILREKQKQFPTWIIPPLSYNFDERLFRLLRKRNLSGPLWQHINVKPKQAVVSPN